MNVWNLTPARMAVLLDAAYHGDAGAPDSVARDVLLRHLANRPAVHAMVWEAWWTLLPGRSTDRQAAGAWLEAELIPWRAPADDGIPGPCPIC